MDLEDRVVLTTPEGLTLELPLAGVGSRFTASLLDWIIRGVLLVALSLLASGFGAFDGGGWGTAAVILAVFGVLFGYDLLFEVAAAGRTPGKRWTGLRVVDAGGGPVRFVPSAIRNLLRLVDFLPGFYLVAIVTVFVSPRNQRLGDMVAGTLVVRERRSSTTPSGAPGAAGWAVTGSSVPAPGSPAVSASAGWDVASVTADELATVRRFLERRADLLPDARSRLGQELAARLRPKVSIPLGDPERPGGEASAVPGAEAFLERLVAVKAAQGR